MFLSTNTYRVMTIALVASLALGAAAIRGQPERDDGCAVQQKVTALLSSWKTAADQARELGSEERAKLDARVAALAGECPIGSRLGATLGAVRDVLAAAIAASAECAKHCPLEKAGAVADEARQLKEDHANALRHLHQLASYAADAAPASACCAESAAPVEPVAAPAAKTASCSTTCTIELAVRIGGLQASWKDAGREVASISPEIRRERLAIMTELAQRSRAVALLPPTVVALADGFDALESIHRRMMEWAAANPGLFAAVPAHAKKAFVEQAALLRETREVLTRARGALEAALGAPAGESRVIQAAGRS